MKTSNLKNITITTLLPLALTFNMSSNVLAANHTTVPNYTSHSDNVEFSETTSKGKTVLNQKINGADGAVGTAEYDDFSISKNAGFNIIYTGNNQTSFNRVISDKVSDITGSITQEYSADGLSGGKFILVNPNGIYVQNGAVIDLNSMLLTTHDVKINKHATKIELQKALNEKGGKKLNGVILIGDNAQLHADKSIVLSSNAIDIGYKAKLTTGTNGNIQLVTSDGVTFRYKQDGTANLLKYNDKTLIASNDTKFEGTPKGQKSLIEINKNSLLEAKDINIISSVKTTTKDPQIKIEGIIKATNATKDSLGNIYIYANGDDLAQTMVEASQGELIANKNIEIGADKIYLEDKKNKEVSLQAKNVILKLNNMSEFAEGTKIQSNTLTISAFKEAENQDIDSSKIEKIANLLNNNESIKTLNLGLKGYTGEIKNDTPTQFDNLRTINFRTSNNIDFSTEGRMRYNVIEGGDSVNLTANNLIAGRMNSTGHITLTSDKFAFTNAPIIAEKLSVQRQDESIAFDTNSKEFRNFLTHKNTDVNLIEIAGAQYPEAEPSDPVVEDPSTDTETPETEEPTTGNETPDVEEPPTTEEPVAENSKEPTPTTTASNNNDAPGRHITNGNPREGLDKRKEVKIIDKRFIFTNFGGAAGKIEIEEDDKE